MSDLSITEDGTYQLKPDIVGGNIKGVVLYVSGEGDGIDDWDASDDAPNLEMEVYYKGLQGKLIPFNKGLALGDVFTLNYGRGIDLFLKVKEMSTDTPWRIDILVRGIY